MKYSELSVDAKERAKQWWAEGECRDFGNDEYTLTDILTVLGHLGFDTDKDDIQWSGFCSQGDGLSFRGGWRASQLDLAALLAHAPEDDDLPGFGATLMALTLRHPSSAAKIIFSYYGCGVPSMSIDETGTGVIDDNGWELTLSDEEAKEFEDTSRRIAKWAYSQLEDEYNYRTSLEQADETLASTDGDYEFDEEGELV